MSKKRKNTIKHDRFSLVAVDRHHLTPKDILNAIDRKDTVEIEELFADAEANGLTNQLIKDLTQSFCYSRALYDLLDTQDLQIIKIVLDRVGYNIITDDDETALSYSAFEGKLDRVKFLVENGAEIDLITPEGNFALYSSVLNLDTDDRNITVFEYLYPLTSLELQREILEYCRENLLFELED